MSQTGAPTRATVAVGDAALRGLAYLGGVTTLGISGARHAALLPFRGRPPRLAPVFHQAMTVAIRALPVLSLITFFIGLILAMQAAYALADVGALRLVAASVAVSMTRELGPLLTAIVVLGRSGSAFAAEIATMKVNQELDALATMALDPVRLFVAPKLLATVLLLPCLSIWSDLMAVLGGSVIGISRAGFTFSSYLEASVDSLYVRDIVTGLVKSVMFGGVIAAVGCYEGFIAGSRPEDVGRSTTAAVVNSIFLVIAVDLLFTTMFYVSGK